MNIFRMCLLEQIQRLMDSRRLAKAAVVVAVLILIAGKAVMPRCRAIWEDTISLDQRDWRNLFSILEAAHQDIRINPEFILSNRSYFHWPEWEILELYPPIPQVSQPKVTATATPNTSRERQCSLKYRLSQPKILSDSALSVKCR